LLKIKSHGGNGGNGENGGNGLDGKKPLINAEEEVKHCRKSA